MHNASGTHGTTFSPCGLFGSIACSSRHRSLQLYLSALCGFHVVPKLGSISINNVANFCFFPLDTLGVTMANPLQFVLSLLWDGLRTWANLELKLLKSYTVRIGVLNLHQEKKGHDLVDLRTRRRGHPQRWIFRYMRGSCSPSRVAWNLCSSLHSLGTV